MEIAITATALPVLVNIQPSNIFDFGEVLSGTCQKTTCTLINESALLPLTVEFRKVPHFSVFPTCAMIEAGKNKVWFPCNCLQILPEARKKLCAYMCCFQDIAITFQPKQAGSFQPLQVIDVLGKLLVDETDVQNQTPKLIMRKFQTIPLQYLGTSVAILKKRVPRFVEIE